MWCAGAGGHWPDTPAPQLTPPSPQSCDSAAECGYWGQLKQNHSFNFITNNNNNIVNNIWEFGRKLSEPNTLSRHDIFMIALMVRK